MRIGIFVRPAAWVLIAAALLLVSVNAPDASADVVPARPHERTVTAVDGRKLVVGHRNETVTRLGMVDGNPTNREVLIDNDAYAAVTSRASAKLGPATLTVGYHVGCAIDLRTVLAGIGATFGLTQTQLTGIKTKITVTPKENAPPEVNLPTLVPGAEIKPTVSIDAIVGSIIDIPLATAPVGKARASIPLRRTSIRVEGCLAPATIRSYVALTSKSALSDESVVVYGDPIVM
ncbi:MspA family porin [Nocardia sp. KC 131]|uniref:MspA family porin n=1 Tax=Nocardia arseniciresistens TaxID=3392119 RepID=UPI00398E5D86